MRSKKDKNKVIPRHSDTTGKWKQRGNLKNNQREITDHLKGTVVMDVWRDWNDSDSATIGQNT